MHILVLSPYDAASHRYWRERLVEMPGEHTFSVTHLPARHFSWRFRGNSLTLAHDATLDETADLIIATSMTDLSALRGMRTALAAKPAIVYFHENQFAYPDNTPGHHQLERQVTSIYTAIAGQAIVFNSEHNRRTFLNGASELLARMPDGVPAGIIERLHTRSHIIPVPLDAHCFPEDNAVACQKPDRFTIVWNHRWEHDKGLLELQQLINRLVASPLDFEMHLVGQQFRQVHPVMRENISLLQKAGRLGHAGYLPHRADYLALLRQSHCVLSTAKHEFQGIAVQEAMAAGCVPVVPDALAYPEYVPGEWRYRTIIEALSLIDKARHAAAPATTGLPREVAVARDWDRLIRNVIRNADQGHQEK